MTYGWGCGHTGGDLTYRWGRGHTGWDLTYSGDVTYRWGRRPHPAGFFLSHLFRQQTRSSRVPIALVPTGNSSSYRYQLSLPLYV